MLNKPYCSASPSGTCILPPSWFLQHDCPQQISCRQPNLLVPANKFPESFHYLQLKNMAQYTEQNNLSKLCPTLGNAMHYSPLGSSVHESLQARILKWVAMPSSRGIFPKQRSNSHLLHPLHWQSGSLLLNHLGSPYLSFTST